MYNVMQHSLKNICIWSTKDTRNMARRRV